MIIRIILFIPWLISLDIEKFCIFIIFLAVHRHCCCCLSISAYARDLEISRETLQLNLVIGLQLKLPVMAAGENGFCFCERI